jgi:hypothetical protein
MDLKQKINECSITFKSFAYNVNQSQKKSNIWNFTISNQNNTKHYAVYCIQSIVKAKSMIKIAMKKTNNNSPPLRLVVVCPQYTQGDEDMAQELGYCLLGFGTIHDYGEDMVKALASVDILTE